jgi:hypothetical protein
MEVAISHLPTRIAGLKVAGVAAFILFVANPIYDFYQNPHSLRQFPAISR